MGPCTMGLPIGYVLSTPSVEEGGTEYSGDGTRDLSGTPTQEPEPQVPPTLTQRDSTVSSQAAKPKLYQQA